MEPEVQQERDRFLCGIVERHSQLLYRVAYSVLRHPEDAEDAVADALLKLLRGNAWRTVQQERSFLARAVFRAALDRRRARAPTGAEEELFEIQDDRPSPEQIASQIGQQRLLHTLLDQMPAALREPLLLSAIEEMNSREIGEVMGLPEGTVRTRLMRARKVLRERYEELQEQVREVAVRGER